MLCNHHMLSSLLILPSFKPWQPLNMLSVSMNLPSLDISCKLNHKYVFFYVYFHQPCFQWLSMQEHVSVLHSLWSNNIPLSGQTTFGYPFSDGHMGCFHLLIVVNSAAMNSCVQCLFGFFSSFAYMPMSRIVGADNSMFNFWRNLYTVFQSHCTFYIHSSSVGGFQLLYVFTNTNFPFFFF